LSDKRDKQRYDQAPGIPPNKTADCIRPTPADLEFVEIGDEGLVFATTAASHRPLEAPVEVLDPGKTSGACPGYRKDHVVPPACGGPDAANKVAYCA
jgi:hypothetical protein